MGSLYTYALCFVIGIVTCITVEIFIIWRSEYSVFESFRCAYNVITSKNRNHISDKEPSHEY